jgi:hypothetical protein
MPLMEWLSSWLWWRLERAEKKTIRDYPGLLHDIQTIAQGRKEAEVYVFFHTDSELNEIVDDDFRKEFEGSFRSNLPWGPPWPANSLQLSLIFDSHENVLDHYEGSYFLRLR